jgi:hypothetical protein
MGIGMQRAAGASDEPPAILVVELKIGLVGCSRPGRLGLDRFRAKCPRRVTLWPLRS